MARFSLANGAGVGGAWLLLLVLFALLISCVAPCHAGVTVVAWGLTENPEALAALSHLTNVVASSSSLVLKADGTVEDFLDIDVPPGLSNVTAIAGDDHFLALRTDGTVIAWGDNNSGQTNVPPYLSNVAAIATGFQHSLALRADGTVVSWGSQGQSDVPLGLRDVIAIAAGVENSLALKKDGTVTAWGRNDEGETNVPAALSNVVAIASGGKYSLALKADGTVTCWGNPSSGDFPLHFVPPLTNSTDVVAIAASFFSSVALKGDGTVTVSADPNSSLSSGLANVPPDLHNVASTSVGREFNLALVSDGPPVLAPALAQAVAPQEGMAALHVQAVGAIPLSYQWMFQGRDLVGETNASLVLANLQGARAGLYSARVSNRLGEVTSSNTLVSVVPLLVVEQPASQSTFYGGSVTFQASANGQGPFQYQWRFNGADIPGESSSQLALVAVRAETAGGYSAVIRNALGAVQSGTATLVVGPVAAWGYNNAGQSTAPAGLTNVLAVAAGLYHSLALVADGTVKGWGDPLAGSAPANLSNVVGIACGYYHSLALRSDGPVAAWGDDGFGQSDVPAGLSNVVAITGGEYHSLALRADGSVVAWGAGEAEVRKELPTDTFNLGQSHVPDGLSNVVAIAAGGFHSLALRDDGTVIAWGSNDSGQAHPPADLVGVQAVAAGWYHSLALKEDSTVLAWGSNANRQTSVLAGLSDVVRIASGWQHNFALQADGTLWAWGSEWHGESEIPNGLEHIVAIAAGGYFSLAVEGDGPPKTAVSLADWRLDAAGFHASLSTDSGRVYRLDYKDAFGTSSWTPLPLVAGNGGTVILSDPSASDRERFYRVRRW